MEPATPDVRPRPAFGIVAWFAWVVVLLGVTGLLLPQIIAFVDFSEKAPFSLLGIVMMAELTQTSACVRNPAAMPRISRSRPSSNPQTVASPSRIRTSWMSRFMPRNS